MGSWGEGRAGPTLQEIKPSHLGRAALRRREGGAAGTLRCVPCRPWPRRLREAASCTLRGNRDRQHCGVATKKKHTSGAHVCNVGSCPRPHGSKQTKKMKHPNHKSEPGPCQEISMLYGLGAEPPLPPRVFDHFSASAVNSVWIGPFFDQKDPPTVRCAWEAVRSLFTLKNAASHPPTLTGYIIWG